MLQAEILKPQDLTREDRLAWKAFQDATPAFASPLLGPAFAEAVAEFRADTAVAVYRRSGAVVGFLAHHRRFPGLGRPIGSPWSDYHALVSAPDAGIVGQEALRLAGLEAFRFSGLIDPYGAFAASAEETADAYLIRLGDAGEDAGEAYWEALRAASPKRFKNMRRLEHKLEREVGEVRLIADRDPANFERLLGWKQDQFRRTGLHDVLATPWSGQLMRSLFARRDGELQGLMLTLTVAGQPIAGHFGVRSGTAFHPWIAAYDPAYAAFSPGQTLISEAIRAMPRLGLQRYDLAEGSEHYKKPFASDVFPIAQGLARTAPATGMAASVERAWTAAGDAFGPSGAQAIRRLRRRMDHIASVELTLAGRAKGLATALAASRRRLEAQTPAEAA